MKNKEDYDPNKRQTIVTGRSVSFRYPEHFSNQQRGFTPAGGAKLNFQHSNKNGNPYVIGGNTISTGRIIGEQEASMVTLFHRGKSKTYQVLADRTKASLILRRLPKAIKSLYI